MDKPRRQSGRTRRPRQLAGDASPLTLLPGGPAAGEMRDLPVLPVRNTVLLPNMVVPLFVDREPAVRAIEACMAADQRLLVVAQRSGDTEDPTAQDVFDVGTECAVTRVLRMPDGAASALVQGVRRLRIDSWLQYTPFGRVRGTAFEDFAPLTEQTEALVRSVIAYLEACSKLDSKITEDALIQAMNIEQPGMLADFVVAQLEPPLAVRQELLETLHPVERLRAACRLLQRERSVLELEHRIHDEVQREAERGQREQLLRDQLKVIQRELGEHDPALAELNELRERVAACGMPPEVRARAEKELDRLQAMPGMSPEAAVLRTYLDWLLSVPWQTATRDDINLRHVAAVLDHHHFGLQRVKDRILEFIAVRKLAPEGRAPILCLAGPPGVGKTSLGRSVAEALGRRFARVSLGGVHDEAEIRGHRRTYVGALPGRIIQAMKTAGVTNPVIVLDEVDKLASDYRGDPSAALLEVLDPEQNGAFADHYLEVPYDLSAVLFILTANVLHTIPAPLRDRMEVIEISGYTEEEKLEIARRYLLPRQMRDTGLNEARIELSDDALRHIIRDYTFEAGVRSLEREIGAVMRRVARRVAEGRRHRATITPPKLASYLGPQKFYPAEAEERDEVGVATGLAWTSAGGDLTTVEVMTVPGHGAINLTGQLGDVMKESAQAAVTFTRARAGALGLNEDFHERCDIHVHLPAGSIPKDGPSAGVTMAVALISALTGRGIRRDVAMTGEITLRGRVLPVGGVKEKVLAAYRAGITTVILPRRNRHDLDELPAAVVERVSIVGVDTMDDVLQHALVPAAGEAELPARDVVRKLRAKARDVQGHAELEDPIAAAGRLAQARSRKPSATRELRPAAGERD